MVAVDGERRIGVGGKEFGGQTFLEKVEYENLPSGRVRCVQTGHEMPATAQGTYATTKKCRAALFEAALARRTPPLDCFDQSPVSRDKIVCKFTGVILNKTEDAVWKHILGKKFMKKLEEKEVEKARTHGDVEMAEGNVPETLISLNGAEDAVSKHKKSQKKKKGKVALGLDARQEEQAESSSEESDFWAPPIGERWDFDVGTGDRWVARDQILPVRGCDEEDSDGGSSKEPMADVDCAMQDGELVDSGSNDGNGLSIRSKPRASAKKSEKRRAKRLRTEL